MCCLHLEVTWKYYQFLYPQPDVQICKMQWEGPNFIFKWTLKKPCRFHHCQRNQKWQDLSHCVKDLAAHSRWLTSVTRGCQVSSVLVDSSSGGGWEDRALRLLVMREGSSTSLCCNSWLRFAKSSTFQGSVRLLVWCCCWRITAVWRKGLHV